MISMLKLTEVITMDIIILKNKNMNILTQNILNSFTINLINKMKSQETLSITKMFPNHTIENKEHINYIKDFVIERNYFIIIKYNQIINNCNNVIIKIINPLIFK